MTIHNETEASALLSAGRASLDDLREIVTSYPQLRPAVAAYPGTDDPLLGWLASLDDLAVNQALATRNRFAPQPPPPPLAYRPIAAPAGGHPRGRSRLPLLLGVGMAVLAVLAAALFLVPRLLPPAPRLVAGASHQCVVMSDGTVSCWGDPPTFGHDEQSGKTLPETINGVSDVTSLAAAGETCAVLSDGTVSCWGPRLSVLAMNGVDSLLTPVPMPGIADAQQVAMGVEHICLILADGSVSCWGGNTVGQLGNGTITGDATDSAATNQVIGISDAVAISAGSGHTCAVTGDGKVKCWGSNDHGQTGSGYAANATTSPVQVLNLDDAEQVAAGAWHTCALLKDRTVACWGLNEAGQVGDTGDQSHLPTPVPGLTDSRAITAGGLHSCAIQKDRTVACWGDNSVGQLGDGTTNSSHVPVQVMNLTDVTGIAAGSVHTCAVRRDRSVFCWGNNGAGQLGTGDNTPSLTPVPVVGLG